MKKILLTATALTMVMATTAVADSTSTSVSASGSIAGANVTNNYIQEGNQAPQNVFEGAEIDANTPGMGGIAGNSTAHCIKANGFGIVGPGAGVQFMNGTIVEDCMTEREAGILIDLLERPNGPGKTAALYHFCNNDDTMKETLVGLGYCEVRAASTAGAPAVQNDRQTVTASYNKCELENGQIRLSVRSGADRDTAISQCKAKLGY